MKPPPFQYHDPKTLAEAVGLLGTLDNAKLLAGGQSLMPMLNMRFVLPDHVIDLNRVEGLSGIKEAGGALEIGAMTRQRDLEFSDLVKAKCPLLHQAIMHIGHRQTRNRGTIGGSLCHLDPAAELVSVCAAHDATVTVAGPERHARDRVRGFPRRLSDAGDRTERDRHRRSASRSGRPGTRRRSSSSPAAMAISPSCRRRRCLQIDGGKIARASVTVGGVAVAPVRASEVEQAITGQAPIERAVRQGLRKLPLRSRRWPTSTPRPTTASISPPCCRAARWRRPRASPTTRRGTGRIRSCDRRDFIATLGGAAAAPMLGSLAARAQQSDAGCRLSAQHVARAVRASCRRAAPGAEGSRLCRGPERRDRIALCGQSTGSAAGFGGRIDPPAGGRDRRRTASAALAAKAATATIPIVFAVGSDPVRDGLVASLNRPGGNVTGVIFLSGVLGTKRLELLRQFVPKATSIAVLVNPNQSEYRGGAKDLQAAAQATRAAAHHSRCRQRAATSKRPLRRFVQRGAGALLVGTGPFLILQSASIVVALAARHALPAIYRQREFVEAGGLMSYGTSHDRAYRQAGIYAGRILKGEKPADLPVDAGHQVRVRHQPQDRQDARPRIPSAAARHRRRGDRMNPRAIRIP